VRDADAFSSIARQAGRTTQTASLPGSWCQICRPMTRRNGRPSVTSSAVP